MTDQQNERPKSPPHGDERTPDKTQGPGERDALRRLRGAREGKDLRILMKGGA